jgi:hypothetical protein
LNFRKHHLAILAICLATAIGSLALAVAQAESTPTWSLSPSNEIGPLLPVELSGKAEGTLDLLFTTGGGTKVEISCEKLALEKALLEAEGKSSGTLSLSGCLTKLNGTTSSACKPFTGAQQGVIKSTALKSQLVLHEGASLARLEPVSGTTLAIVEVGEECAIGEEVPVTGVFYAKESAGELEVLKEAHTFEAGPLTAVKALGQTATFGGKAGFNPLGEHLGRRWSGSG